MFQAAQVLAARKIQALWVTGDNTAIQAFEAIAKVAADARLPLVINDPEFTERGALVAVGIGWQKTCHEAAKRVAQVLMARLSAAAVREHCNQTTRPELRRRTQAGDNLSAGVDPGGGRELGGRFAASAIFRAGNYLISSERF